ncbi:MAG: replication-associated recombination protein A [Planctomycetota bacterium]|nr:replication-associated recombination protein A [Planctomycetota bacterium]
MTDLWAQRRDDSIRAVEPLAVRMRPRTLDEIAGQEHILGPGKLLRRMLAADAITSLILHGPPGTGKTTLAEVIAGHTKRAFVRENAASVGVKRIREFVEEAGNRLDLERRRTILFLDEIHRFTRAQQDVLLADVERGLITLIGATTENPLFAVNSALVSRSTLLRLEPLSEDAIIGVLRRAIADPQRGYGRLPVRVADDALAVWAAKSDGDARRALTALEVAVLSSKSHATQDELVIDRAAAEDSIQQKAAVYDGTGDEHYDTISAFIKSVRGTDPDAAVYWLARMIEAGEDPRFIARRLAILASEDIGNADPRGIMVAAAAWELVERVGMPEARIILAQCTTYLALAPKSNASYLAIDAAVADVREGRTIPVPVHIKDGNVRKATAMSAGATRGASYDYAHDHADGLGRQDYLGVEKRYYVPTDRGAEKAMAEVLERARAARREGPPPPA